MKRSRIEIMAEIIQDCLLPRRKTHIMYSGNLSFAKTNAYLSLLIGQRLLLHKDGEYEATDRGRQFLSVYDQLEQMMGVHASPIAELRVFSGSSAPPTY